MKVCKNSKFMIYFIKGGIEYLSSEIKQLDQKQYLNV